MRNSTQNSLNMLNYGELDSTFSKNVTFRDSKLSMGKSTNKHENMLNYGENSAHFESISPYLSMFSWFLVDFPILGFDSRKVTFFRKCWVNFIIVEHILAIFSGSPHSWEFEERSLLKKRSIQRFWNIGIILVRLENLQNGSIWTKNQRGTPLRNGQNSTFLRHGHHFGETRKPSKYLDLDKKSKGYPFTKWSKFNVFLDMSFSRFLWGRNVPFLYSSFHFIVKHRWYRGHTTTTPHGP